MKKFVLLLISLLIAVNCAMAVPKVIDLDKENNPKAASILYSYFIEKNNWTKEYAEEEFACTKDRAVATFVDLNDDGINEVVGVMTMGWYSCVEGEALFILKKIGNKYHNISTQPNIKPRKITILDTKTKGWHDINASLQTFRLVPPLELTGIKEAKIISNGKVYYYPHSLDCEKLECKLYIYD